MKIVTPYPGERLDDELGLRIIRAFVYKFAHDEFVVRKKKYDREAKCLTEKTYLHIRITPPFWGNKFELAKKTDRSIFLEDFFLTKEKLIFLPHYRIKGDDKKTNIYCSTPKQVIDFFDNQKEEEAQNIYIFDTSFTWFIDVFDELRKNATDNKDYYILFYNKVNTL